MSAPARPRPTASTSPSLAVAGLLMMFVIFLANNPYFGIGLRQWPWEVFRVTDDWLAKVTFVLWGLAALWAIFTSFFQRSSARSTVLLALMAPILLTAAGEGAAFPMGRHHLAQMIIMIVIGAGLWLGGGSRAGRALGLIGGLVFFWDLAVTNDPDLARSRMLVFSDEIGQALRGESVRPTQMNYIWWQLVPFVLTATGALIGILQSLLRNKWVSRIGWLLVLVGLIFSFGVRLATAKRITMDLVAQSAFITLATNGVAIWLVATFTIADATYDGEAEGSAS